MRPSTVSVAEAAERLQVPPSQVVELLRSGELEAEFEPALERLFEVTEASVESYQRSSASRRCDTAPDPVMTIGVAARLLGTSEAEVAARITVGDLDGVEIDGVTYVRLQSRSDGTQHRATPRT